MNGAADHKINTVAIIGAGTMGREVSWACAKNGFNVRIYEQDDEARRNAETTLHEWFDLDFSEEKSQDAKSRTYMAASLEDALEGVDLAFENVPEIIELKQKVHKQIDEIAADHVLQGSNASALKCSSIASATKRADRFFNMNFTFPRAGNQLVELMPNPETNPATMAAAKNWAQRIGMIPIALNREILGYVQNRIWRAIKKECLFLVDQGYTTPSDIDRGFMLAMGLKTGPFALMDKIGLPTVKKIEDTYYAETGDPSDRPPACLTDLIEKGFVGANSEGGFYSYPNPEYEQDGWLEGLTPKDESLDD